MATRRIIGDIHGKVSEYKQIIECPHPTIQVGDFGAGFMMLPKLDSKDRVIRGNHDSLSAIRGWDNWIPDGTVEGGVMFIGGAWSIDWKYRVPGISWWSDEELSHSELMRMIEIATTEFPKIIISHDAPDSAIEASGFIPKGRPKFPTRTSAALDSILELAPPKLWIFGHWHKTHRFSVGETTFQCLGELDWIDVDFDTI